MILICDRSLVCGGIYVFPILGDAPPLLPGVVGCFAVYFRNEKAVLAFRSCNQILLFQCFAQILAVSLEVKVLTGTIPMYDCDSNALFALFCLRKIIPVKEKAPINSMRSKMADMTIALFFIV